MFTAQGMLVMAQVPTTRPLSRANSQPRALGRPCGRRAQAFVRFGGDQCGRHCQQPL